MAREMKESGISWIGKIPYNWNYGKCKMILTANDGGVWGNDPSESDSDKIVIRSTEQTIDGKWCIETPAKRDLTGIDYSKAKIEVNDLLITKSSGSDSHIGKTTIADDYFLHHECYYSNFIQRIRCRDYNPRLLWYLFNSPIIREQCVFLQNTTSGIGNINASIIDNLLIPIPPLSEQQSIVALLDKECACIDAVMEQTRASIEEYKKLKQAIIAQAVTKGIRPNRPMKDSGVDWIETIPSDWQMIRGKGLFVETNVRSDDGSEELLTVSQYTGITPRSQKTVNMFEAETLEGYKVCEIGDIAANTMWLWAGAIGVSQYKGVISPSYNIYRQIGNAYVSKYLDYMLRVPPLVQHYESLSTGIRASRLRLYPEQFLGIRFPVPSIEEQRQIVDYLDAKAVEMDNLIEKKEELLAELESYKKALIYEYVTGKKEI